MSNENLEAPGKICLYWLLRISTTVQYSTMRLKNWYCMLSYFLLLSCVLVKGLYA